MPLLRFQLYVFRGLGLLCAALLGCGCTAWAQTLGTDSQATVTIVLEGLSQPSGMALRPGGRRSGSDLYIANSGTGAIVAIASAKANSEPKDVVTGLAPGAMQCLVFRSRNALVVGMQSDNEQPARLLEFDIETDSLPLGAGDTKASLIYETDNNKATFAGVARNNEAIYFTTDRDNRVLRSKLRGPQPGSLKTFFDAAAKVNCSATTGIAISGKGYLVVAHPVAAKNATQLVFYHPYNAATEPALSLELALPNIVALGYSVDGNLYAAHSPQGSDVPSGIYRIDSHRDEATQKLGCKPTLIAELTNPTSLAFAENETIFVTTRGEGSSDGRLLQFKMK